MKVLFAESEFWKTHKDFQTRYEGKVLRAALSVSKILKHLPKDVTFVAQADTIDCMPETGDGGFTKNSRLIILSIDPGLPYGEEKLLHQVRETVFHELSHAARFEQGHWHNTFLERCVLEGIATVFERECAGAEPLYGLYDEADVGVWIEEIQNQFTEDQHYKYMFRHEDGRRWIGYKTGTYIVDKAMKNTGKNIIQMTQMDAKDILKSVGIKQ